MHVLYNVQIINLGVFVNRGSTVHQDHYIVSFSTPSNLALSAIVVRFQTKSVVITVHLGYHSLAQRFMRFQIDITTL